MPVILMCPRGIECKVDGCPYAHTPEEQVKLQREFDKRRELNNRQGAMPNKGGRGANKGGRGAKKGQELPPHLLFPESKFFARLAEFNTMAKNPPTLPPSPLPLPPFVSSPPPSVSSSLPLLPSKQTEKKTQQEREQRDIDTYKATLKMIAQLREKEHIKRWMREEEGRLLLEKAFPTPPLSEIY